MPHSWWAYNIIITDIYIFSHCIVLLPKSNNDQGCRITFRQVNKNAKFSILSYAKSNNGHSFNKWTGFRITVQGHQVSNFVILTKIWQAQYSRFHTAIVGGLFTQLAVHFISQLWIFVADLEWKEIYMVFTWQNGTFAVLCRTYSLTSLLHFFFLILLYVLLLI